MDLLRDVDQAFKSRGINPGTTADLTVACLLADDLSVAT
jgi:triphosphoribosyl-dephospho-CoA synthase